MNWKRVEEENSDQKENRKQVVRRKDNLTLYLKINQNYLPL